MSDAEKRDKSISNWWFVLLIVVCVLLWIVGLWGTHQYVNSLYVIRSPEDILTNPGVFGDSSGAINALFSALAFAGVIFAIILQKKELQLQREELKQTREELEGQKHEFEQQNVTLKRQRFENTFFNMLDLQQKIVQGICFKYAKVTKSNNETISEDKVELHGREVFQYMYIMFFEKSCVTIKEQISLEHYYKHLNCILKFVDESTLLSDSYEERFQYIDIAMASLSKYELLWLFQEYKMDDNSNFRKLIEKYALLKDMDCSLLIKPDRKELYALSAYEKVVSQEN